jgi:hypothetical protein
MRNGWRSPRIAWSLWSITFVLLVFVWGLIFLHRSISRDAAFMLPRIAGSVLVLSTATIGALVASRRPRNPIGWIFCSIALLWDFGALVTEYAIHALTDELHFLPAGGLAAWLAAWVLIPTGVAMIFVLLLMPSGRLPSRRWRSVGWAAVVGTVLMVFGIAVAPGPPDTTLFSAPDNPFAIESLPGVRTVEVIGLGLTLTCALLAATSLIARLRRSRGMERQQLKWFAFGEAYVVSVFSGMGFWMFGFGLTLSSPIGQLAATLGVLSLAVVPITTGIAILRYRLYDIDIIINRTLVYGTVTALLAGLFAGLSILSQRLVLAITGQESQAAVVLAALVVTALFQPLRARVQTVVDHRFYRRKYDAARTLERFASQIRDEVELDRLTAGLVAVVRETMQPTHASLWLGPSGQSKATVDRRT